MKRVLIFFNAEPVSVISVMRSVTGIRCNYPDGKEVYLKIMSAGFPSLTDGGKIVHFASDRELTSEEIFEAARNYPVHRGAK